MIDDYDYNKEKRMKRSKGVEELYDIVDDIKYCIYRSKNIGNNRLTKWYNHRKYNKLVNKELRCYEKHEDFSQLVIAIQHQTYNDCLEALLTEQ